MVNERDAKALGELLRRRRVVIPLTLHQLAEMADVSPSHLGRIEKGKRFPSAHILKRVAKPLGFEENELFTLAGYLTRQPFMTAEKPVQYDSTHLDPYVAMALSQEPVEVQRALIAILSILKNIANAEKNHSQATR
ncbi:MAG: helix-turn-helix transcriptional regulator [Chloroflexi bacterium]|nr:helix-turn-helix transcriptional regulator [Chloroflexota bacterium]